MHTPSSGSDSEFDGSGDGLPPNPALALFQHPRADELRTTLNESLPFSSGTLELPPDSRILFYGKGDRLDLSNPTLSVLDNLEKTCDPIALAVDNRGVQDESYRKAGELDSRYFAFNLNLEREELLEAIRTGLFTGRDERRAIHAELYTLNIYGKDSFYQSHKNTPRGTSMFGSLILVLPTPHAGGSLILEHQGNKWTFDAAQALSPPPHAITALVPRIDYIAFLNDVAHELTRVTSGHRLTVTYALHFSQPSPSPSSPSPSTHRGLTVTQPRAANAPAVERALAALLADPTLLPHGGTLGFGLRHLYTHAFPPSFRPHTDTTLEVLRGRLKGADAALVRACAARGLRAGLYAVYEWRDPAADEGDGRRALIAFPRVVQFDTHSYYDEEDGVLWGKLCRRFGGVLVNALPSDLTGLPANPEGNREGGEGGIEWREVRWVTALGDVNRVRTRFAAVYGTEPEMGCLDQRICLLVDVGPPGGRGDVGV